MPLTQHCTIPTYNSLMRYAKMLGFGEIYTKIDATSGFHAIIAIHNTQLGPAIGGCRFHTYSAPELALKDVLRLSFGMTLKAAACGLPHGGAKAVILKPRGDFDRQTLFRSFGDFVHELNGRYITAVDLGSNVDDMTTVFERTPYVIGAKGPGRVDVDPSPSTALGIFRAMQAAIQFEWQRRDFKGLRVAVQGVGHAGYPLVKLLIEHGATVIVSDLNQNAIDRCVKEFSVDVVAPAQFNSIECDILSPCAMGGTISLDSLHHLKTKMIAGSANNQLAHHNIAHALQSHGILYLPDFLINSGGLINAATTYTYQDLTLSYQKIDHIYDATMTMLERAKKSGKTPTRVAEEMAFEKLRG